MAVDELIYAETYPPPDAKARVLRTERQCGGLAAIALIAAARLGAKCAYAGVLGKDALSQFAIDEMRKERVDMRYLKQRPSARPVHSFIVVDTKTGTRNIFCDVAGMIGADDHWPSAQVICSARVLFVDHFSLSGTIRAVRIARKAGIPVVADFERISGAEFSTLLALADHLIVSQTFAEKLTGKSNPIKAAQSLWRDDRKMVAITCGEKGCWYLDAAAPDMIQHQPAFEVKVVDTTGCGDVFHGAYAAALARGVESGERIRFASAVAALKATRRGAQAGIPSLSQVKKFLRKAHTATDGM